MGEESFYQIMADLSQVRHPLVQISDTAQRGLGIVTITKEGRNVLEGQADHIGLNGIDRGCGGVHLQGDTAAWRWNPASQRLVSNE